MPFGLFLEPSLANHSPFGAPIKRLSLNLAVLAVSGIAIGRIKPAMAGQVVVCWRLVSWRLRKTTRPGYCRSHRQREGVPG